MPAMTAATTTSRLMWPATKGILSASFLSAVKIKSILKMNSFLISTLCSDFLLSIRIIIIGHGNNGNAMCKHTFQELISFFA